MTGSNHRFLLAFVLLGCRPVVPPEPPDRDPAHPDAPIGRSDTAPSPFERSAFEGEELDRSEHHHGHHTAHGDGEETPKPTSSHDHDHAQHGTSHQ